MGAGKLPSDFGRREEALSPTHIFTSQDFSWLQKGQVNWVSKVPVIFFLGGGFRLDFLHPMSVGGQTLLSPRCDGLFTRETAFSSHHTSTYGTQEI